MEVIVGTYEELILGYKLNSSDKGCSLQTSFTDHSHTGCVRCVAISENGYLASGSSDESIKLFNLKKRKEVGSLVHHNGYISSLSFFGKSHMFSCSADGTIGVWRIGKWECEKILRGHKEAVLSVSIHHSGKLALSISHKKMRTWNLLTGKCAYITNIKNGDLVKWSPDGEMYVLVSRDVVHIYNTETADVISSPAFGFRINCVHFVKNDVMVVGGEGGSVHFYCLKQKSNVHKLDTCTIRVKDLSVCKVEGQTKLVTGSSEGYIKVWNVVQEKDTWKTTLEASVDTKFRIVSLAVRSLTPGADSCQSGGKVKKSQAAVEESSGEEDIMSSDESEDESEEDEDSISISDDDVEQDITDSGSELEIPEPVKTKVSPKQKMKNSNKMGDPHKNKSKGGKKQQVEVEGSQKPKKDTKENLSKANGNKGSKSKNKKLQKKKQLKKLKLKGSKHKNRQK